MSTNMSTKETRATPARSEKSLQERGENEETLRTIVREVVREEMSKRQKELLGILDALTREISALVVALTSKQNATTEATTTPSRSPTPPVLSEGGHPHTAAHLPSGGHTPTTEKDPEGMRQINPWKVLQNEKRCTEETRAWLKNKAPGIRTVEDLAQFRRSTYVNMGCPKACLVEIETLLTQGNLTFKPEKEQPTS